VGRLNALRNDPRVAYIEENQQVFAFDLPTGIDRIDAEPGAVLKPQFNVSSPVDVDIAIIDTGLDIDHPDLNVVGGRRFYTQVICILGICLPAGSYQDDKYDDDHGHGTHVGGTAAGRGIGVVGVAPGARLWGVKVLDKNGSGYMTDIIAGIDWVTARASTIEVANMSLGCVCSSAALDTALSNSIAAGVVYAVAAGNDNQNASTFSPAKHPGVITVSAFSDFDGQPGGLGSATCRADEDDSRANFSNYGSVVEIAAPGVCILSSWIGGGYLTISGTSMASPHVAGAAALYRAANPGASPSQVRSALIAAGDPAPCATLTGICTDDPDGIQEPLLDVGDTSAPPPPPPPPADSPTPTHTLTPSDTPTNTPTYTDTPTHTATAINKPTATDTPTATPVTSLTVTRVYPNPLWTSVNPAGTFVYGTGFMPGAVVTFENGNGTSPMPVVLDTGVMNSTTIALLLQLTNSGPRKQVWDVRVTNPDGATAVLVDGLTIERR
jgi:subtilisin family serine protease